MVRRQMLQRGGGRAGHAKTTRLHLRPDDRRKPSCNPLAIAAGWGVSSSAVAIEVPWPPPPRPRKKYRMSENDRETRSKHIRQFQPLGAAASAKRPKEDRVRCSSMGGQALYDNYRKMKEALSVESPESIRARRKTLEGKRDELLDHLLACAAGRADLQADLGVIKAALAELRPEIGLLIDREERAKVAPPAPVAPRAPIAPIAPIAPLPPSAPAASGPPSAGIPQADSPPVSPD